MADVSGSIPEGSIDESSIRALVHGFYGRVRQDPLIGPVFEGEIAAADWPTHLERMCAFWSSSLLRTGRYDGRPLPPHLRLKNVGDEHFRRWLTLFAETAQEVFEATEAAVVIDLAERIAHSFRLARAFSAGEPSHRIKMIRVTPPSAPDRS